MKTCGVFAVCVAAITCIAAPAAAQTPRATGPFAGLFGGPSPQTQTLDVRGSLFGLYQDVLVPEDTLQSLDPRFQKTSTLGGASATLSYASNRRGDNSSFVFGGRGGVADYSVSPDVPQAFFDARTALSTRLARKISFNASGGASYAPYYDFAPFATEGFSDPSLSTPEFGFAALAQPLVNVNAAFGVTDNFTKRSSMSLQVDGHESRLIGSDIGTIGNIRMYGAQATFNHRLTRTMGFHLGYGRRQETTYGTPDTPAPRYDSIDAGLDYGGSVARRTTLSFGTSTAIAYWANSSHVRLNGNAAITRGIGRTWSASAAYARAMESMVGFRAPVLSDSVNVSAGGLVAPRVTWRAGVGWTRGQVGFGGTDPFSAYMGRSGIQVALTRKLAAYAQYGYYRYQVPVRSTTLALLSHFERQTVSIGLRAWLPLLHGERTRP
jgi:hypothetical protein